eukprot:3447858-Rhodomonas_salina.1
MMLKTSATLKKHPLKKTALRSVADILYPYHRYTIQRIAPYARSVQEIPYRRSRAMPEATRGLYRSTPLSTVPPHAGSVRQRFVAR